jgi:hypothetical protein
MSGGNALAWVGAPSGRLLAKWSVVPERFPRLAETAPERVDPLEVFEASRTR